MFSKGQVLNGRYRLVSLQGQGGMASVYRAYDLTLERTVAIKVLQPGYDAGDAFRHEARAIAKLPHPNIVTVFDVGQHDGANYIVMEFVEGQDLKQQIKAEAPFRTGHALDIIVQICEAVGFAHAQGILHCDLKPQNVLVLPSGQVKVADFGIARVLSTASVTPSTKTWGTPHYAPPEQIAGQALTTASDVYAIGVILYEMLAGRLPFEGQDAIEIARQHAQNAPPPLQSYNPRVPQGIAQVLDRTLAKDPARRYSTAQQLGGLLAAYRRRGEAITQPLQPIAVTDEPSPAKGASEEPSSPLLDRPAAQAPPISSPGVPFGGISQPQPRRQFDWTLLILAALAFVAVVGLIPLWGTVISRAIGQRDFVPANKASIPATPTPTNTVERTTFADPPTTTPSVTVPNLVGRPLEQARQLVQSAQLEWSVGEQRHDAQIPDQHVISQDPIAGAQAPQGANVTVIASLGPEQVAMPDTVGFPLSVKRLDLEDLGLVVVVTDTWSTEPPGLIVHQEPSAGTEVGVGSVVTLSISTGSRSLVEANLDDKLVLYSAESNGTTFRPGDTMQIMITWHVLDQLPAAYTTFIHVTDSDDQIAAQLDQPPLGGSRPTNTWRAGEQFLDPYSVPFPTHMRPGTYWVRIGLYRGTQRLPVSDPGSAQTENDAVIVQKITVTTN